jgi:DNA-binding CsgD family transcriptional regulator
MVFGVRDPSDETDLARLPELVLQGLEARDARLLLASVLPARLDERVFDRIVAETRGNPLALLELPRGLTPAELAGGFRLPDARPLSSRIEQNFIRRLRALPEATQQLLLLVATETVGDVTLLWRAAEQLGIAPAAAAPAQAAGLLEVGAGVWFRHPLVRSASYRARSPHDRRRAHAALADATDPDTDPDRRAWHRAHAAVGPDEAVANELERSAERAQARGGPAAAAAFLERATALTPDPARRGARALAAAQAKHEAGAPDAALALVTAAEAGPLDELDRARAELLRAQIAWASSWGANVPPLLLQAARRLQALDVPLARATYLDALSAALIVGHLADEGSALEVATAARTAPPPAQPRAPDLLLDGLAVLITEGHAAGAPALRRALDAFRSDDVTVHEELRWLWLAAFAATFVWDDAAWAELSIRQLQLARDAAVLSVLPTALSTHIGVVVAAGELAEAASLIAELDEATNAVGTQRTPYGALAHAALRGREAEALELIAAVRTEVVARNEGMGLTTIRWSRAVIYNGLGRYEEALDAAQQATAGRDALGPTTGGLEELVEAAVRSGRDDVACGALRRLSASTRASQTDWALGIEARSRALVSEGEVAERLYREAIDRLGRTRVRIALARAHLLYGEWLRRERRRADAREQLHAAHDMFDAMGAEAFAERARRELAATGETVRTRTLEARDDLTPHETQIARMACDGLTSPEIAAQLFISPRTVDWHLRKVFAKLGINSRRQLALALPETH